MASAPRNRNGIVWLATLSGIQDFASTVKITQRWRVSYGTGGLPPVPVRHCPHQELL